MTDLVANVYAATIIPVPASTLALVLRLKARRMTRMGFGYDDGLAIAAWIFAMGYTVDLIVWAACFKLGQRLGSYDEPTVDYYMEKSRLILWTSEFLYAWSIVCAKLAVLCFYRRLFQFSSIRIPVIILMVACGIWIVLRTFFTIFHCLPVQAYWDQSIQNAKCLTNVSAFYLGTDVTHCLMDFIILALPIYEVFRMMKLPFGQKIAVICLFATGSLVGIASIFQIVQSQEYNPATKELPYELALAMIWGNVEVHLAVFIGSLALLRPIFRKFIPGLSTANSNTIISHPSRSSSAFQPVSRFKSPRSPRDEEAPDAARGFDYYDHDIASLPEPKGNNSSLRQDVVHHQEHQMDNLPGAQDIDSRFSQSSIR